MNIVSTFQHHSQQVCNDKIILWTESSKTVDWCLSNCVVLISQEQSASQTSQDLVLTEILTEMLTEMLTDAKG